MNAGARLFFLVLVLLLGGVIAATLGERVEIPSVGQLRIYQGSVEIVRGGSTQPSSTGAAVRAGDTLKTGADSRVAIELQDGSVVRLEANSVVTIHQLTYQGDTIQRAQLDLDAGRLWSRVAPLADDGTFTVETPTIVSIVHGTSFNTDYLEANSVVYVASRDVSSALTAQRSEQHTVKAGFHLYIRDDQQAADFAQGPQPIPQHYLDDDWISFNQREDVRLGEPIEDRQNSDGGQTPAPTDVPATRAATSAVADTPTTTPPPTITIPTKSVVGLDVSCTPTSAPTTTAPPPRTAQCQATAVFDDDTTEDVTDQATWSIVEPANGTINDTGFYAAGKIPRDTVLATYADQQAETVVDLSST